MGTTVKATINGHWTEIPQTSSQARDLGWHLGAEYTLFEFVDHSPRFGKICEWCHNTFDQYAFKAFAGGVYFYDEKDALLCRIRWAR